MTFKFEYITKEGKTVCMFDIEYFLKESETKQTEGLWYSEIDCLPCVEGITRFLHDKFQEDDFDFEEFIKGGLEIQEVRGLLYERYNNKPKQKLEAYNFHHHEFYSVIKSLFLKFSEKYGLHINVD